MFTWELTSIAGAEPEALAQAFLYLSIVDLVLKKRKKNKELAIASYILFLVS